jgi:putative transposase
MSDEYDWRTGRSCVFKVQYHLVFVPKYRRDVFTDEMLVRLDEVYRETCLQMEGELLEFNGESDHVHLLVVCPPKQSISNFVGKLKGKSAYVLRKEFAVEVKKKLWGEMFWSPSYCVVSCGGAPLEVIKAYIQDQRRPPSIKGATHSSKIRKQL